MIRVLVVDDEAPARDRLRRLLDRHDDVEVVGEAGDGVEAIERIADLEPSLVFLDIEMPGLTGMQVAAALEPPRPNIVFCTAYDQYAIEAFEHHATDYVLKPVSTRRLERTLARVRERVEASLRAARELDAASATQRRLLTPSPARTDGLRLAGHCRALRGVGGDYYDFIELGARRVGVALADVAGKGIYAGLLAANLQARVRDAARRHGDDLSALAATLNEELHAVTENHRYATFFFGRVDLEAGTLAWLNAGQPAALLLRADGNAEWLASGGPPIGMLPGARHEVAKTRFDAGDLLVACSDGVTEAENAAGEELGREALVKLVGARRDDGAEAVRDAIVQAVERHVGGALQDDLTVVVARREA